MCRIYVVCVCVYVLVSVKLECVKRNIVNFSVTITHYLLIIASLHTVTVTVSVIYSGFPHIVNMQLLFINTINCNYHEIVVQ
jgi:hypothetical protein